MTLILSLWLAVLLQQQPDCWAVHVIDNGLTAFDAGTPQIALYTQPDAYLIDAIQWVYRACGSGTPLPLDWLERLNS